MSSGGSNGGWPLLLRLRAAAIAISLALIAFLVVADVLGRLYVDPAFRIGDLVFGTLAGVLLTLLGFEGLARFVERK